MALTLDRTFIVSIMLMMVTWAPHIMSRTLLEVSIAQKHEQWMAQYGRTYKDQAEKDMRLQIFKKNYEFIEKFNNEGSRSYNLSINEFSDLTNEEFLASHTGYKTPTQQIQSTTSFMYENVTEVPTSLDWREKGAVTAVKYQGQCGCCWAFSAVAAVEGINQIKNGVLNSLSEQQLLDCSIEGNSGCNGGWMNNAFKYIEQNQGLTTSSNYPYQQTQGTCDTQRASVRSAKISGHENVPANDENALLQAVTMQPVSVTIDARGQAFQSYSYGVFEGDCDTAPTHAVVIVGYGTTEEGIKYWLIKNSWGESWGENGYMNIRRDVGAAEGLCGIARYASYPIIA